MFGLLKVLGFTAVIGTAATAGAGLLVLALVVSPVAFFLLPPRLTR